MRILADENVPPHLIAWLREEGNDVLAVCELARGSDDESVMSLGGAQSRVILTSDLDFGDLVFRRGGPAAGVVLLRFRSSSGQEFCDLFRRFWPRIVPYAEGNFVIVTNRSLRIRPLP